MFCRGNNISRIVSVVLIAVGLGLVILSLPCWAWLFLAGIILIILGIITFRN